MFVTNRPKTLSPKIRFIATGVGFPHPQRKNIVGIRNIMGKFLPIDTPTTFLGFIVLGYPMLLPLATMARFRAL